MSPCIVVARAVGGLLEAAGTLVGSDTSWLYGLYFGRFIQFSVEATILSVHLFMSRLTLLLVVATEEWWRRKHCGYIRQQSNELNHIYAADCVDKALYTSTRSEASTKAPI